MDTITSVVFLKKKKKKMSFWKYVPDILLPDLTTEQKQDDNLPQKTMKILLVQMNQIDT